MFDVTAERHSDLRNLVSFPKASKDTQGSGPSQDGLASVGCYVAKMYLGKSCFSPDDFPARGENKATVNDYPWLPLQPQKGTLDKGYGAQFQLSTHPKLCPILGYSASYLVYPGFGIQCLEEPNQWETKPVGQ